MLKKIDVEKKIIKSLKNYLRDYLSATNSESPFYFHHQGTSMRK